MKLTPIRVRGKRGQPKSNKISSSQSHDTLESSTSDGQPKPKRAKTRKANDGSSESRRMNRGLPRLLQLPQEMLEGIFIASRNLSLPLVNRELLHRLSTDSIKYQLVGAAFGPTWKAWYGIDAAEVHSYAGWLTDGDHITGDPHFQSALIGCSWATYDMMVLSLNVWIRQNSHGRPYFTVPGLKEERLYMIPQPGSLYDKAYNDGVWREEIPRLLSSSSATMSLDDKLALDLLHFRNHCIHMQTAFADEPPESRFARREIQRHSQFMGALLGAHIEVHPDITIPDRLLAGPYESEAGDGNLDIGERKMHLLFWLVRGGARIQATQTWESSREGFRAMLQLVTRVQAGRTASEVVKRRVTLAMQLLCLFTTLNIFATVWPKYITQTSLTHVLTLASQADRETLQGACLQTFAAILRRAMDRPLQLVRSDDSQWRGPRTLFYRPWIRPVPRNLEIQLADIYRMARAKLFLCAPDVEDTPQVVRSSRAALPEDEGVGVVHEPWSDFGLE